MKYDNVVLHFLHYGCWCRHLIQLGHWPLVLQVGGKTCLSWGDVCFEVLLQKLECMSGGASGTPVSK